MLCWIQAKAVRGRPTVVSLTEHEGCERLRRAGVGYGIPEAERRALPATSWSRSPRPTGPAAAASPSPAGLATLGGRLRPLGLDAPAMPPGRRPGRAGAPAVTGPLAQRRQRPRRRTTPNANTTTTTMISTHNHVDMAASLVGAGAGRGDATATHPSKQLGHGQATSRIDGRATRGLAGPPAPRDLPADLGWPGGCQPDLPADDAQDRVGRALRATPSQSQPNRIDQHHRRGGPSRRQPTSTTAVAPRRLRAAPTRHRS
jgi:hypothetical protein